MKDIYSKYWITAREEIYGFSEYDKNLCDYISEHVSIKGKLLEVAIGTGYPIADFLQKAGYSVYGVDISLDLVEKCRRINPNINCIVGDAEDLSYLDSYFDCAYCFHSTWYFPIIFDIQNRNSKKIEEAYCTHLSKVKEQNRAIIKILRYVKNIAKIVLRRGTPVWWSPIVYEVPTYPESLYEHFKQIGIFDFQVMVRKTDDTLELREEKGSFEEYDRLVFVVRK